MSIFQRQFQRRIFIKTRAIVLSDSCGVFRGNIPEVQDICRSWLYPLLGLIFRFLSSLFDVLPFYTVLSAMSLFMWKECREMILSGRSFLQRSFKSCLLKKREEKNWSQSRIIQAKFLNFFCLRKWLKYKLDLTVYLSNSSIRPSIRYLSERKAHSGGSKTMQFCNYSNTVSEEIELSACQSMNETWVSTW